MGNLVLEIVSSGEYLNYSLNKELDEIWRVFYIFIIIIIMAIQM